MKFLEYTEKIKLLYNIFEEFQENETSNKQELLDLLPKQYKTKAKLDYLAEIKDDDITELQFIKLLLIQTHPDDYINYEYFIKYYDLKLDNNNMIIFTKDFTYTMCKKETLYIWWIIKNFQMHRLFTSYMDSSIIYSFQKRLELTSLNASHNKKYDLCFQNQEILVEINEPHHATNTEKNKDYVKFSVAKLNGIQLISLVTDKVDKINQFLTNVINKSNLKFSKIYKKLHKDIIKEFSNLPEDDEIDIDELEYYLDQLIDYRLYNKKHEYPSELNEFLKDSEYDKEFYQKYVDKHIKNIIDTHVESEIQNSNELTKFLDIIFHRMLCSMLSDYSFMQDYIKKVFKKEMFNYLLETTKFISVCETIQDLQLNDKNFIDRYDLLKRFIEESGEFDQLFLMKKKSLENSNHNVISIDEVIDLLNITDSEKFIKKVCFICNINSDELVSWKNIQTIILSQPDTNNFKQMLLLYYIEIDAIYLNISKYVSAHNARINGAKDDFENNEKHREKKTNDLLMSQLKSVIKYLKNVKVDDDILTNLLTKFKTPLNKNLKVKKAIVNTEANLNKLYEVANIDIEVTEADLEEALENFKIVYVIKELDIN